MPGTVNCTSIPKPDWQNQSQFSATDGITIYHGITAELISQYETCFQLLSADEKAIALRFRHQDHRQRYVLQHGLLRRVLSLQTGVSANAIQFAFNINQKPYLPNNQDIHFNLSNSNGHFLIAIGREEMGIDLEYIKPDFHYQDIASNYFGKTEVAFIHQSPNAAEAFFLLWTRKEALLKACGMGIDDNLPAVPALDGQHVLPDYYPDKNWLTQSFAVDNFMMSITYASPEKAISFITIRQ